MKKTYFILILVAMTLTIGVIVVKANPSYFAPTVQTGTATTTLSWMTPGVATTTLIYDAFDSSSGSVKKSDSASLLTQIVASSTGSVLGIKIEFANGFTSNGVNCKTTPTACDWFPASNYNSSTATSTYVQSPAVLLWNPTVSATSTMHIIIETPLRYTRISYYVPIGSANLNVWGQIQPVKETP